MINFATSHCFPTYSESSRYPALRNAEKQVHDVTIAPVYNSAGRQAQSSASSTLSPKRDPTTEDPDEASSVSSVSASQDNGDKQACTSTLKEK